MVAAGVVFSVRGVCYAGACKYRADWVPCARGGVTPGNDFGPTRGAVLRDMLSRCPKLESLVVAGAYHSCEVAGPGGMAVCRGSVVFGRERGRFGCFSYELLSCDRPHVVMA